MKHIFNSVLFCALSLALVSCTKAESSKEEEKEKEVIATVLEATVTMDFIDIFDFSFTLNGNPVTMKKEKDGNTTVFSYSDGKLHGDEEVKCTVTVLPTADVKSLSDKCSFSAMRSYMSGQGSSTGYSKLFSSVGQINVVGLSYDKMVEEKVISDKAGYAAYIGDKISVILSGTMTQKK